MTATAQRDARRLTELLAQQRDVYQRLRELAMSQSKAIEDDQPESLLRILADRQRLINELTRVNELLEPFRSRWDQLREALEPTQRLEVSELVDQVQQLLGQILDCDKQDSDLLRERTAQTRDQAARAGAGARMNQAYAAGAYQNNPPRAIDRNDEDA